MAYWLFKTEPGTFSIHDLAQSPNNTARWDEIRNYQARNFIRDEINTGDTVFIYHSQTKPTAIVGTAKVVSEAYADPAQFDLNNRHFDSKAHKDTPRWFCLNVKHLETFLNPLTLKTIKNTAELATMVLLKQGRLSVQPITVKEATQIFKMIAP